MSKDEFRLPNWDRSSLTVARAYEAMSLTPGCGIEQANRRYVLIAGANFPDLVFSGGLSDPRKHDQIQLLMAAYKLVRDEEARIANLGAPRRRTSAELPLVDELAPDSDDPLLADAPISSGVEVQSSTPGLPIITPRALNAFARGQAFMAESDHTAAASAFNVACDSFPGNPLFELMRDWAEYLAGQCTARACEGRIEQTLRRLPESIGHLRAECWVLLARLAFERRDYTTSRERYRAALEYAPRHPEAAAGAVARPETPSPSGPGRRPHTESPP